MILAAIAEYDFKRVTVLSDSLQNTGDISAVTANYYHGAALTHSGMVRSATRWHHNLLQLKQYSNAFSSIVLGIPLKALMITMPFLTILKSKILLFICLFQEFFVILRQN